MGWENRNGRLYYYRKRRNSQVVSSEYFGSGSSADLIALIDGVEREERRSERMKWTELWATLAALDSQVTAFDTSARAILSAALLVGGFRPHKGQWRKKRDVE